MRMRKTTEKLLQRKSSGSFGTGIVKKLRNVLVEKKLTTSYKNLFYNLELKVVFSALKTRMMP